MPDMPYVPNDSMNIMGLYFPQSSATPRILSQMRKAIFSGQKADISASEVLESQKEIAEMRKTIDGVTPEFSQHLNNTVLGDGNKVDSLRTIFLTYADYIGPDREVIRGNVVIPRDLGTHAWSMYRGEQGYDSVDTKITAEESQQYIRENGGALRDMGIENVFIKTSSFFYVKDEDLRKQGFIDSEDVLDLDTLVTYLADSHGFVGLQEMQKPTEEEYMRRAMPFNASRQKQTVEQKVGRKIRQYQSFRHEGDVISDWGANRIVPLTEDDTIDWGTQFRGDAKVCKFATIALHVDDYYTNPKPNGFKNYNITMRIDSRRHNSTIRELQVRDLLQHFNSEINEESPYYHGKFRERQGESSKKRQNLMEELGYDDILKRMFDARELEFPVTSKK